MSILVQKGLWQDQYLADTKEKLAELYKENPYIAKSPKVATIAFWKEYEGLQNILGERFDAFKQWYLKATSNESITRSLRSLKEDGTIHQTKAQRERTNELEGQFRQFFGNQTMKENQGREVAGVME